MTYTKQTWTNGSAGDTPISAARLSHMEDGIEDAGLASGLGHIIRTTDAASPFTVNDDTSTLLTEAIMDLEEENTGSFATWSNAQDGYIFDIDCWIRVTYEIEVLPTTATAGYIGASARITPTPADGSPQPYIRSDPFSLNNVSPVSLYGEGIRYVEATNILKLYTQLASVGANKTVDFVELVITRIQ